MRLAQQIYSDFSLGHSLFFANCLHEIADFIKSSMYYIEDKTLAELSTTELK